MMMMMTFMLEVPTLELKGLTVSDVCVALQTRKMKYSLFYSICVLMFMYYTVCCFTGVLYAVERHISVLFTDSKDAVFCSVKIIMTRKVDKAIRPV